MISKVFNFLFSEDCVERILTLDNADDADDKVRSREEFHSPFNTVAHFIGTLYFLQRVNDNLHRLHGANFVDTIER